MRALLVLALVAGWTPSIAMPETDAERQVHVFIHAQQECRIGETFTGLELTAEQSDKACAIRDAAIAGLKAAGFCFNELEQEWSRCGTGTPVPTPRP